MRKTLIAVLLALPLAAFAGNPQTVVLDVRNMTCSLCPITIQKALQKVPGVADAKVDYAKKTATVKYDPDKASPAALVKATTDAGFPSTPHGESKR
jgi:mercuric ion binding protein